MSPSKILLLSVALELAAAMGAAQAATVYPVSATASSEYPGYPAGAAIDIGGTFTDWANHSVGAGSYLQLDLGAVYSLANAYVTDRVTSGGPNNSYAGGIFDYTTSFTLQGYTDASFTVTDTALFVGSRTYPPSDAVGNYCPIGSLSACFETTLALAGATSEFWLYTIVSQNQSLGAYNNAGLSDIHFSTATPLPAALPLFAGGLGLIGAIGAWRRRKVQVQPA
jgi:hypothetical protein